MAPIREPHGHYGKDSKGRRHAGHPQPEIFVLLRNTVGMDDTSSHKRKAKQMYEPRPRALHLDESGEQQGERDIFGEVRMNSHYAFQMNVASGADCHLRAPPRLNNPCG
jgi:hypothetical protein